MEYIKEDQVLLYEELCAKPVDENDLIVRATKRFRENIRLAASTALKMSYPKDAAIDREDMLQAAYEGLWVACLKFDESLGNKFSTLAIPYIRGYISRMLRENEALRTPRIFKDIRYALYSHGFTLPLTDEEIDVLVSEGKFSRKQIMDYAEPNIISLDADINDDGESSQYSEIIADPNAVYDHELSEDEIENIVDGVLKYINHAHRDLVEEWMYATLEGYHIKQSVLAKKYRKSQSYVARILHTAISLVQMNGDHVRDLFGL